MAHRTLGAVYDMALKIEPDNSGRMLRAAVFLLSAVELGTTNRKRLSAFTHFDTEEFDSFYSQAVKNGYFVRGKIHANWFEDSGIFIVDTLVVGTNGLIKRE